MIDFDKKDNLYECKKSENVLPYLCKIVAQCCLSKQCRSDQTAPKGAV